MKHLVIDILFIIAITIGFVLIMGIAIQDLNSHQENPVSKLPDKIAQLAIVQEKLVLHIAGLQADIAALKSQLTEAPSQDDLDKLQESIDKLASALPDAPSVVGQGN